MGLFDGLGVALGAGVQQFDKMNEQDLRVKAEERAREQLKLMQNADARAQETQGFQVSKLRDDETMRNNLRKHLEETRMAEKAILAGDHSLANPYLDAYNTNKAPFNNGYRLQRAKASDGSEVFQHVNPKGEVVDTSPFDNNSVLDLYRKARAHEFYSQSPELYAAFLKQQEDGAKEERKLTSAEKIAAGSDASHLEGIRLNNEGAAKRVGQAAYIENALKESGIKKAIEAGDALFAESSMPYTRGLTAAQALGADGAEAAKIYQMWASPEPDLRAQNKRKIEAAARGIGGNAAHDTAEVRNAKAAVDAGMFKNMADAMAWAHSSRTPPEGSYAQKVYLAATQAGHPHDVAMEMAEKSKGVGKTSTPGTPSAVTITFKDMKEAETAAAKGLIGSGQRVTVAGKTYKWQD